MDMLNDALKAEAKARGIIKRVNNAIKTYRYYNHKTETRGRPFGMCQNHLRTHKMPPDCTMTEFKESTAVCEQCEIEEFYRRTGDV